MVGSLQDLLDIGYPYLFLISVAVAIIAAMCTAFYFDHENRKRVKILVGILLIARRYQIIRSFFVQGRRQKEVCLSSSGDEEPIEELSSEEMETVSEKSKEEDETELEEGESGVEEVGGGGGAGDEEVVGLMSRLKNARLKEIEEALTEEQLKSEKE